MPKSNNQEENLEEIQNEEALEERSDSLLDNLFSDEPIAPDKEEVVEDDSEEEVVEEDAEEEEVEDDDSEVDWDAEPSKKKKDAENDDEEFKDDSAAVRQAKIKGREAKELKAKLTERELELERIQKERDEVRARLEEVEATKIKPEDHPEYTSLREEILTDVGEASDLLSVPDPNLVTKNFGVFMADYLKMSDLSGDDRAEARTALKAAIVDRLKLSEVPYAELESDERREYEATVTDILKIIQRNAGKTKELQKLHGTLTERAKTGLLSVGVRQYDSTVGEFKPVLDSVGSLAEDVIEANPYAVESIVSKLVKDSPEAAKRLEKAKADVLEVIVGPRALKQSEIDKLEAAGENVKEFMAERAKSHRAKQLKFAAWFVQGLMTRSTLKETLAKLSKLEKDTDAEESELDILRKTTKKTALPKKKDDVRPKDRVSPLTSLLGFDEDDD
jgi:hypothetical protein